MAVGDRPLGNMVIGLSMDGTQFSNSLTGIRNQVRQAQSAMRANLAVLSEAGTEYDRMQSRVRGLTSVMEANQRQIDLLRTRHQNAIQTYGESSDQVARYARQINDAVANQAAWERQLRQTQTRLTDMDRPSVQFANRIREMGTQARESGARIKEIGRSITQTVGAATAVLGAGLGLAAKSAMEFESQISSVQSVMAPDDVAKYGKELEQLAITMGSKTKYSATQAAQGIEELVKAGVSVSDIMNGGLSGALNLATAGELELKDAAEIASTALNAFRDDNISVAQAADILAGAANASATDVGELKFGLSRVSAVAAGVGLNFKDTATALAVFAQNGLKGEDSGTSLKTMLLNLTPHTKAAAEQMSVLGLGATNAGQAYQWLTDKGMKPASKMTTDVIDSLMKLAKRQAGAGASAAKVAKEYDKLAQYSGFASSAFYDANGNLKSMSDIAGILQGALKSLNSEQRQQALQTMFGTDAIRAGNILYKEGAKGIDGMAASMDKIKASDVAKKKLDNFKGTVEQLKGSLETAGISIGNALLPALKSVTEAIKKVVDWFNGLPKGMQETIATSALVVVALGGIISALGFVAMGIGGFLSSLGTLVGFLLPAAEGIGATAAAGTSLTGALAGAGGAAGLFSGALAVITGPIGLTVAAIAALGFAAYEFDKAMDKPIMKSKVFTDEISKSTQKAVGSYLNLDEKATESLNQMSWSQVTITQDMADKLTGIYDKMNQKILDSMDKRHTSEKSKMQEVFAENNALTAEEEAKILATADKNYSDKKQKEQSYRDQINQIITNAKNQHRALTEEERVQIAGIQQQMKETAVVTMSKSEEEQRIILGRLKSEAGKISAEQAADVVANSKKQRDKSVEHANSQYRDTVREIEYMRDVTGVITADQAAKMIAKAKEQKDSVVDSANLMHDEVVFSARKQAGEHADQVDWETGKVLTGWDSMYNGVVKAYNWIKELFGLKPTPLKGTVKYSPVTFSQVHGGGGHAVSAYAKGTKNGQHLGGPAIVGEEGRELAYIPDVGLTMLGNNGSELISDLPAGTSVLPNKYTENLLKSFGFPGYATGIGDYFSTILKGPKALWNVAASRFGISNNILPSWMANLTDYVGMIGDFSKNALQNIINDLLGNSGGSGSASAQKWIMAAMKITGTPDNYLGSLMAIARSESGFNPRSINLWDSNAKAGHPSKGLFQTIDSTFNRYKLAGLGDIYNPVANAVAAIRYMISRYGSISNVPGLKSIAKGGNYVGYANGGLVANEQIARIAEGNKPEAIIPLDPLKRTRAMQLLAQTQQVLGVPSGGTVVVNNDQSELIARHDKEISLMQQMIGLLANLLVKDTNIEIDGRMIAKTTAEYMQEELDFIAGRKRAFGGA